MLFDLLNCFFVRFSRYPRTCGFGIQSPFDYSFVRDVLSERLSYYAYDNILSDFPQVGSSLHRLGKLYLRLSNWRQPSVFFDAHPSLLLQNYVSAGCRHVKIVSRIDELLHVELARLKFSEADIEMLDRLIEKADEKSVIVVEGINEDITAKRFWESIRQKENVGTTFDLYDAGIVLFDSYRSAHHYKINI